MALKIDQLIALGCWTYEPKSKKPAGAGQVAKTLFVFAC